MWLGVPRPAWRPCSLIGEGPPGTGFLGYGEVPRQRGIILNLSAFQKVKRREIHLCGLVHTDAAAGREFVYGVLDTERVAVAWSQ